jgi:hypothetical protein
MKNKQPYRMLIAAVVSFGVLASVVTAAAESDDYQVITLVQLRKRIDSPFGRGATTWLGMFYCGTKNGYHYLRNRRFGDKDERFRVSTDQLTLPNSKNYPLKKWVEVSKIIMGEKWPKEIEGQSDF